MRRHRACGVRVHRAAASSESAVDVGDDEVLMPMPYYLYLTQMQAVLHAQYGHKVARGVEGGADYIMRPGPYNSKLFFWQDV